jgi:hypothetical protein
LIINYYFGLPARFICERCGQPARQMRDLGQKNERQLIYLRTKLDNWKANLPSSNWLVLPIGHNRDKELINDITDTCLNNGVKYVCTLGQECEFIHDFFDDSIVMKRIDNGLSVEHEDDFEYEPMTTWHNDFDEGVWFAIHAAHDNYVNIDKLVFLDMTDNGELERIERAIEKE